MLPHTESHLPEVIARPSLRSFVLTWVAVLMLWAFLPLVRHHEWRPLGLELAAILVVAAWIIPSVVQRLALLWQKFGLLLHEFVQPVILGVMFFFVICPVALLSKIFGKSFLPLRANKDVNSYWIHREGKGPSAASLRRQF